MQRCWRVMCYGRKEFIVQSSTHIQLAGVGRFVHHGTAVPPFDFEKKKKRRVRSAISVSPRFAHHTSNLLELLNLVERTTQEISVVYGKRNNSETNFGACDPATNRPGDVQ